MIKVIAIDLGGVYFAEGKSAAAEKLNKEYGYDKKIIKLFLKSPKSLELRKGLISDEVFWSEAKHDLPPSYNPELIRQVWYDSYTMNKDIDNLVNSLRDKYKLIIWSENIPSRVEYLDNKYHFREKFHQEIYSYDLHLLKYYSINENKGFYTALIEKSKSRPDKILVIDDGDEAVENLKLLGMKAVIYHQGHIEQLRENLKSYGVIVN